MGFAWSPSSRCADSLPRALNKRSLEAAIAVAAKFLNAAAKPVLIAGNYGTPISVKYTATNLRFASR